MLFGLAVEMDHVFRSSWQVNHLSELGYSLSSYEVTRCKQSVIENENGFEWLKRMMLGSFCHWIADNVDHNVRTLDGKGTLHAMGIIVTTTGPNVSNQDLPKIPQTKLKNVGKLIQKKGIPMLSYVRPDVSRLLKLLLKVYDVLKTTYTPPKDTIIYLLWHSAYVFKKC